MQDGKFLLRLVLLLYIYPPSEIITLMSLHLSPLRAGFAKTSALLLLTLCPPCVAPALAQEAAATTAPVAVAPGTPETTKFKARKVGNSLIYLPETVALSRLSKLPNQTIEVRGIISSFQGIKQRYSFATDDGASILVIGDFPSQGGVTYYLRARVVEDNGKIALSEIDKQLEPFGTPAKSESLLDNPNAPLIAGGGLLILVALGTLGILSMKGKAAERERVLQQQMEEERRRAEAAAKPLKAPKPVGAAGGTGAAGGPGGTVVASGANRAHTVASRGTIRIESGPHAGMTFPLVDGETRIGRKAEERCTVLLDKDVAVSSHHANLITTRDGRLVFEDKSSNGSVVDGQFIQRSQRDINSGSKIQIGASTLAVELFAPLAQPAAAPAATPATTPAPNGGAPALNGSAPGGKRDSPTVIAPAPAVSGAAPGGKRDAPTVAVKTDDVQSALNADPLAKASAASSAAPARAAATAVGYGAEFEVTSGPESGKRIAITKATVTLGREDRDILLSDASVSRAHATFAVRDGHYYLADDNSAHGTKVNGEKLGAQGRELHNGDEIALGNKTVLKFHCIGGGGHAT